MDFTKQKWFCATVYKNDNGGIILIYRYVGVSSDKTIWIPKS